MRLAVERIIGRGKFDMEIVMEALKHNNVDSILFRSHMKIMKHEIAVQAFNKNWDLTKVLNLWARVPASSPSFPPNIVARDEVLCLLVYDISFDDLVKKIVQMYNLKAFL